MKWKKGTPKKTEYTGIFKGTKCFVRRQVPNNPPSYNVDWWMGNRWNKGASGNNKVTHHIIIKDVKG